MITLLLIVIVAMISGINQAAETTKTVYSIEFDPTSPIKEIPLKNEEFKIAIYKDGVPKGYENIITDENQSFSLDQKYPTSVAIQVLSIKNEIKYKALCEGAAAPGVTTIKIICIGQ